ncbi:MAG: hypothetical protein IKX97_01565, partial [Erysipelotrichaceae bacterium]|nr:hypothetical protein [Erysipelotrichaceae bacterium]
DEIYQNNISDLQAQKNELVSRYEDKLTQIQNEYDNQVSSLNQKYNDDLEEAKNEHERRLEEINNKNEQNDSGAKNRFAQAQARYEGAKDELSVDIDRLTSESQQKIANLHAHMDELNDSIAKMKVEIEAEEANNAMQIQSLEKERDEKIQEIVRQHEEAVARIVEEYETVPTAQLQQIRDEYTLKQVEYNENAADISSRKHKIDEEEADAIRKNALQKEVIENKYTSTNNEYLRYKKEVEDTEVQLNDDYLKRQAQLEDYKEELASQIEVVRQQKQQELEAVEKKNNEELENKKLRFKANEEVVEKQYEDKINSYRENLQVKQNNLNSLMTEIDLRRKNVEQQNTEKYNEAIEQTKSIQKKLDDMLDANDIKRSELSNALIQKKEMIESELNEVSTSYNNILEEKRQAYNQLNSDIREKCESLRSEIANLEQRKALEISRMQTYEEEKKYLMDERKNETVDHVNNISKQIENIVKQTRELEKAHKDRVVFLKEQIASTMTEYDDLLRIKPSLIEDVDKEYENDLVKMTKEFRDTLDELEVTHKQILEQLATKRDEAIENINKEIENLDLTRTNRLKEFEDEVRKISSAYDVMLKDEHDKQNILNDHIAKAMSEQEKFIQNMHNQDLTAVTEYEKEKQRLADIHEENLKNSLDDFNQSSDNYKKEIEKLLFTKSELDNELSALLEKNRIIDEEIVEEELKLKYQCNTILFEARKLLEQRQNEKKKELNKLDIMKG